jgi:hypothetical protein
MDNPCIATKSDAAAAALLLALCVAAGWLVNLFTGSSLAGVMAMAALAAGVMAPRESRECKAWKAARMAQEEAPEWLTALAIPAPT